LSARPNPQVWYTGSAVDQEVHDEGVVFARVRERGHRGGDPSLAYFEWSVEAVDDDGNPVPPDQVDGALLADEASWAQANPGLGIRISAEHVANELRSMDARTFAVERLGIGDWPKTDGRVVSPIDWEKWAALVDEDSEIVGSVRFAVDVTPDRSKAAISASGQRADGLVHVEIVEHKRGTGWVVDRLVELVSDHHAAEVVCDTRGPAAALIRDLEDARLPLRLMSTADVVNACGTLVDHVDQRTLRHLGSGELSLAVRNAATRPLGDAWAWSRRSSKVDISPLVAATIGVWAASEAVGSVYATRGALVL
jgi:hypothetical protein